LPTSFLVYNSVTPRFSPSALHWDTLSNFSFQLESNTSSCYVVLTVESGDEIQKCDHSSERHWAVLFCGTVYFAVWGGSNLWVCGSNPKVWPFK